MNAIDSDTAGFDTWYGAPSLAELEAMPTTHVGQASDLKLERYEDGPNGTLLLVRYWLNRCDLADGETHQVDVEARTCPNGSWFVVAKLYPY